MTDNGQIVQASRVEKIEGKLDRVAIGNIAASNNGGGIGITTLADLLEVSKLMSISGTAVPKHLRENPGACMAVCIQSIEWGMSPWAVANKSYSVNDRMAYESAIFHAVVQKRAPIKGRVKSEYTGAGGTRSCRIWAELSDGSGDMVDYVSPEIGAIKPKNSPLWISDPDQQLFYFSVRSWCRRHFPDVMMGIYTEDEMVPADVVPVKSELDRRLEQVTAQAAQPSASADSPSASPASGGPISDEEAALDAAAEKPATVKAPPMQRLAKPVEQGQSQRPDENAEPPLPENEEQLVDAVSRMCGIPMDDAAARLKVAMPKPWAKVTMKAAFWTRLWNGEIENLIPTRLIPA